MLLKKAAVAPARVRTQHLSTAISIDDQLATELILHVCTVAACNARCCEAATPKCSDPRTDSPLCPALLLACRPASAPRLPLSGTALTVPSSWVGASLQLRSSVSFSGTQPVWRAFVPQTKESCLCILSSQGSAVDLPASSSRKDLFLCIGPGVQQGSPPAPPAAAQQSAC